MSPRRGLSGFLGLPIWGLGVLREEQKEEVLAASGSIGVEWGLGRRKGGEKPGHFV